MANPNPSPSTRFGADGVSNPSRGRQRAARDKISTAFLEALNDAFSEPNGEGGIKGLDAIKKVRDEDPATFARIYASLLPKQLEITDEDPISNLTDEQLEAYCAELERQISERAARPSIPAIVATGSQRVN